MSNASHSRPPGPRQTSSVQYARSVEGLTVPDGQVGEETTELLNEFVHPHHHGEEATLVDSDEPSGIEDDEIARRSQLPWWKRPSPVWLLVAIPFSAVVSTATMAPRVEIYTLLACAAHKPDIFRQNFPGLELGLQAVSSGGLEVDSPSFSAAPLTHFDQYVGPVYFPAGTDTNDTKSPPNGNLCASDPVVQAYVAKLIAVISGCTGVLSFITTGWWGAFGDRHGRVLVMGMSILGLLAADAGFILVTKYAQRLPGNYWWLVVGPTIEGAMGGLATGVAAAHAYVTDTTSEHDRSRYLSLNLGLLFTGMAFGSTFGSILIRLTGHTLSVFYAAALCHVLYTILVWFILPESVTKRQMTLAKANYEAELMDNAAERERGAAVGFLYRLRRIFSFLSPLTVILPVEPKFNKNPLKKPKKDWNLTLMVIAYGFTISIMGSYQYKFQYAASQFGWTSEIIGYWLSLVGATRAVFLTLVLPVIIKLFKPKPLILESSGRQDASETTPLLQSSTSGSGPSSLGAKPTKKEVHSPSFDLGLARFSLLVEIIAYMFMAMAKTPLPFTAFSMISSFGTGFSPAVQSVALALYTRRGGSESGRLFGALSVVQAFSSQVFGPTMYGFVYVKTVASFPRAIFFVTVASIVISFILLALVRLPSAKDYRREAIIDPEESVADPGVANAARAQEATLVDDGVDDRPSKDSKVVKRKVGQPSSYGTAALSAADQPALG